MNSMSWARIHCLSSTFRSEDQFHILCVYVSGTQRSFNAWGDLTYPYKILLVAVIYRVDTFGLFNFCTGLPHLKLVG